MTCYSGLVTFQVVFSYQNEDQTQRSTFESIIGFLVLHKEYRYDIKTNFHSKDSLKEEWVVKLKFIIFRSLDNFDLIFGLILVDHVILLGTL